MENLSERKTPIGTAKEIATLSKLIKPIFTKIDKKNFVIIEGTPIPYGLYLYIIISNISRNKNIFDSDEYSPIYKSVNSETYQAFKKEGYLIPDNFLNCSNSQDTINEIEIFLEKILPFSDIEKLYELMEDIEYQYKLSEEK